MLPFHNFSTLLASSNLQTFILPFSISLSSACATKTTPKTMALHTKPRDYIAFVPFLFLTLSWVHVFGGLNVVVHTRLCVCDF